jgi:hypothetical protein
MDSFLIDPGRGQTAGVLRTSEKPLSAIIRQRSPVYQIPRTYSSEKSLLCGIKNKKKKVKRLEWKELKAVT